MRWLVIWYQFILPVMETARCQKNASLSLSLGSPTSLFFLISSLLLFHPPFCSHFIAFLHSSHLPLFSSSSLLRSFHSSFNLPSSSFSSLFPNFMFLFLLHFFFFLFPLPLSSFSILSFPLSSPPPSLMWFFFSNVHRGWQNGSAPPS